MKIFKINKENKSEFTNYIEKMLVAQALMQHQEIVGKENWKEGTVIKYWIEKGEDEYDDDTLKLYVQYESGKTWCYSDIDSGTNMNYAEIKNK